MSVAENEIWSATVFRVKQVTTSNLMHRNERQQVLMFMNGPVCGPRKPLALTRCGSVCVRVCAIWQHISIVVCLYKMFSFIFAWNFIFGRTSKREFSVRTRPTDFTHFKFSYSIFNCKHDYSRWQAAVEWMWVASTRIVYAITVLWACEHCMTRDDLNWIVQWHIKIIRIRNEYSAEFEVRHGRTNTRMKSKFSPIRFYQIE